MVDDTLQRSFEGLSNLDVIQDAGLKSNLSQWYRQQMKEQFSAVVLSLKYSCYCLPSPVSCFWSMAYEGIEKL